VEVAQHRKGGRGTGPATVIGPEWQHKHLERATKAPEKGELFDAVICATQEVFVHLYEFAPLFLSF
jgi:hypothetical protein